MKARYIKINEDVKLRTPGVKDEVNQCE